MRCPSVASTFRKRCQMKPTIFRGDETAATCLPRLERTLCHRDATPQPNPTGQ